MKGLTERDTEEHREVKTERGMDKDPGDSKGGTVEIDRERDSQRDTQRERYIHIANERTRYQYYRRERKESQA